jgi:hypothetical protein
MKQIEGELSKISERGVALSHPKAENTWKGGGAPLT